MTNIKICTGCGRFNDEPLGGTAYSCCPDSNYKPVTSELVREFYVPIYAQTKYVKFLGLLRNVRRLLASEKNKVKYRDYQIKKLKDERDALNEAKDKLEKELKLYENAVIVDDPVNKQELAITGIEKEYLTTLN